MNSTVKKRKGDFGLNDYQKNIQILDGLFEQFAEKKVTSQFKTLAELIPDKVEEKLMA